MEASEGVMEGKQEETPGSDGPNSGGVGLHGEEKPLEASDDRNMESESDFGAPEAFREDHEGPKKASDNSEDASVKKAPEPREENENLGHPNQGSSAFEDEASKTKGTRESPEVPAKSADFANQSLAEKGIDEQGVAMPTGPIEAIGSDDGSQSARSASPQSHRKAKRAPPNTRKSDEAYRGELSRSQEEDQYHRDIRDREDIRRSSGRRDISSASPNRTRFKSNSSRRSGMDQSRRRSSSRGPKSRRRASTSLDSESSSDGQQYKRRSQMNSRMAQGVA